MKTLKNKKNKQLAAHLSNVRNLFEGDKKSQRQSKNKWLVWLKDFLGLFLRLIMKIIKTTIRLFSNPVVRYGAFLAFALFLLGFAYILNELPSPRRLTHNDNYAVSTQIFDRHGELLYEIYANENRIPIEIETLPPYVYQASIAIEDQNFFRHIGFDLEGIARAALNNLRGQRLEGGSTITQQLVKNALLSKERTITRKIKEGVLAVFTEAIYTKEEILEMYLNYISYGGTAVGIEAAARSYFEKSAQDLTLGEAALLAGLPKAPSTYSPFGSNPEAAKRRQLEVLRRMREDGYIAADEEKAAGEEVLAFALSRTDIKAPHFVFYVRDVLYEEYGVETVEKGGLRVTTTLDLELHNTAQASVSAEIANLANYRVGNGAAMVVKPDTGEILSMVGSKDYFNATDEGQVNVTLANRQPGSSIKPITYATAMQEKVLNPGSLLLDIPTCFEVTGQPPYCPKNYDGGFRGPVTVRQSLGNSLNIPAVKALRTVGLRNFINQANAMGIESWQDPSRYGLSLTLGGGEVKMIELAQAFGVLANKGVKVPLTPILKVETYTGKVLYEVKPEDRQERLTELNQTDSRSKSGELQRVMDRAPAYMVSHIMQDNDARRMAFGANSQLVIPDQVVSVKTGTTNDLRDNWTVGFTPEFLVITWVGNNDNTPMNQRLVSGVTGAAPIWNDIMSYILRDREPIWQEKPENVASAPVCLTGMPPGDNNRCSVRGTDLFWEEAKPSVAQMTEKEFWIDPTTGLPPPYGAEVEDLILETHTFYQDPVTEFYCADCNRPVNESGSVQYERYTVNENYTIGSSNYFEQSVFSQNE